MMWFYRFEVWFGVVWMSVVICWCYLFLGSVMVKGVGLVFVFLLSFMLFI